MQMPHSAHVLSNARRKLERGDAGADYGTSFYTLFLFGLMLSGFMLAALGFWRATASAQAERAAYVSGTYLRQFSDDGSLNDAFWVSMTGKADRATHATVGRSTVVVTFRRTSTLWSPLTGIFQGDQDADMEKYLEQFRPGGAE
jgi:hypothetical protein